LARCAAGGTGAPLSLTAGGQPEDQERASFLINLKAKALKMSDGRWRSFEHLCGGLINVAMKMGDRRWHSFEMICQALINT
jgi:microcystin degradation protein MlrC